MANVLGFNCCSYSYYTGMFLVIRARGFRALAQEAKAMIRKFWFDRPYSLVVIYFTSYGLKL